MFVRKSNNLVRSAMRFRGALKQGFSTLKPTSIPGRFARRMLFTTFMPVGLYIYCKDEDDAVDIVQTDANLSDGESRAIQVGPKEDDQVLLLMANGKYYCVQNKCSHFGFALSKGILVGDKLICPLHNATFDVKTGMAETGPIFDGLETYKIEESGGKIKIHVPKNKLNTNKKPILTKKVNNDHPMVIIGGGPASEAALETLRKAGHTGKITLITKDGLLPYDRTSLSKRWNAAPGNIKIRPTQFYTQNGIDVMTDSQVKTINYDTKEVILNSGKKIPYEKLLISSGCENIAPSNISSFSGLPLLQLRSYKDFATIKDAIQADPSKAVRNVTIIGGGFIGWQLASTIKSEYKDKVNVTIVDQNQLPHEKVFGPEVAKILRRIAEQNGIKYQTNATIRGPGLQDGGQVTKLILSNKHQVDTDILIGATGVRPVTSFVGQLTVDTKNKGIKTDTFLRTSQKDVFAAGDVASYPYWVTGQHIRTEHYNEAIHQGEVAALNMLGKKFAMDSVPFFWSRAYNNSIQYIGYASNWDQIIVKGKPEKSEFVAYYIRDNKVIAASCMNSLNSIMALREAMKYGLLPSAQVIRSGDFDPMSLLDQIKKQKPTCSKCDLLSNQL